MKCSFISKISMLAFVSAMVGCKSESTDVYNPAGASEQAHATFSETFVKEFGQPDPNQTWGFGETGDGVRSVATRAEDEGQALSNSELIAMGSGIVNLSVDELKAAGFKRVIAEDLAAGSSDFDYNDIVFDAKRVAEAGSGDYATFYLIVRAAGATKPIVVGDEEAEGRFEVHELFGVDSVTMVNTINKDQAKDKGAYWSKDHEPVFVELKVKKTGSAEPTLIDLPIYADNNLLPLTAKKGRPAEKLCVDPDFSWVKERTKMREWYPTFVHYVVGEEPETSWWHATYWDDIAQAPDWGTGVTVTIKGRLYQIVFEQQNVPDGKLYFSTERPIKITVYDVTNPASQEVVNLNGTSNKISVLCSGNSSHFKNSIRYSGDKTATLVTPDAEMVIIHAPVRITLTVNGNTASVTSTINIWPDSYLKRYL